MDMDKKKKKVGGLFEELANIVSGANLGNGKEPVWDGTVIGKPQQHILEDLGLVECSHGYYFPTPLGEILHAAFIQEKPLVLARLNLQLEDQSQISREGHLTAENQKS